MSTRKLLTTLALAILLATGAKTGNGAQLALIALAIYTTTVTFHPKTKTETGTPERKQQ